MLETRQVQKNLDERLLDDFLGIVPTTGMSEHAGKQPVFVQIDKLAIR